MSCLPWAVMRASPLCSEVPVALRRHGPSGAGWVFSACGRVHVRRPSSQFPDRPLPLPRSRMGLSWSPGAQFRLLPEAQPRALCSPEAWQGAPSCVGQVAAGSWLSPSVLQARAACRACWET